MPSPSVALLRTQSDERLAALAAAGHERAFEAIVERYRRPLLRHCRRYLPEARAEDALQQALVAAWTALRRGDDVQALRPWLYRIVHNTALNALRAAGYDYEELREILLPTDAGEGPAELAEHRAVVRRTLAGLAALPERQREALLQIAVEGRSQDEVAADLGLSTGGVRQLVHRARTSLRTAATAAVPLPLAGWLATAGGGRADVAVRVGELVAGAGAGATLAKAGTVAVLAGGIVSGPAVVDELGGRDHKLERAAAAARQDAGREARRAEPAVAEATAAPVPAAAPRTPSAAAPREEAGRAPSAPRRERDRESGAERPREDGDRPRSGGGGERPDARDDGERDEGWRDRGSGDEPDEGSDDEGRDDAGGDRGRDRSRDGDAARRDDDEGGEEAGQETEDDEPGHAPPAAPDGSGPAQGSDDGVADDDGPDSSGKGSGDEGAEPEHGEFED